MFKKLLLTSLFIPMLLLAGCDSDESVSQAKNSPVKIYDNSVVKVFTVGVSGSEKIESMINGYLNSIENIDDYTVSTAISEHNIIVTLNWRYK